jgi:hypothetical protein
VVVVARVHLICRRASCPYWNSFTNMPEDFHEYTGTASQICRKIFMNILEQLHKHAGRFS